MLQSLGFDAAGDRCDGGTGRAAPGCTWQNEKTRRDPELLQFPAYDLLCCCIDGKTQHLLAHPRDFVTESGVLDRPDSRAEQLRRGDMTGGLECRADRCARHIGVLVALSRTARTLSIGFGLGSDRQRAI